jgi:hypothetical protein
MPYRNEPACRQVSRNRQRNNATNHAKVTPAEGGYRFNGTSGRRRSSGIVDRRTHRLEDPPTEAHPVASRSRNQQSRNTVDKKLTESGDESGRLAG